MAKSYSHGGKREKSISRVNQRRRHKLKRKSKPTRKQKKILKRKQIIQQKRNERIIKAQYEEQEQKANYYRYSIGYFNAIYDKTFRAEVYTTAKMNENSAKAQLEAFLSRRISMQNKGLQKMYHLSEYMGFEAEEIGVNDLGSSQLNKMHFWID